MCSVSPCTPGSWLYISSGCMHHQFFWSCGTHDKAPKTVMKSRWKNLVAPMKCQFFIFIGQQWMGANEKGPMKLAILGFHWYSYPFNFNGFLWSGMKDVRAALNGNGCTWRKPSLPETERNTMHSEVADMNTTSEDQLTEKEDTNPDEHKCSLFGCRPRWMQFFAKPYWFLLVLNLFIVFEGAIVSGMDVVAKQGVCVCGVRDWLMAIISFRVLRFSSVFECAWCRAWARNR